MVKKIVGLCLSGVTLLLLAVGVWQFYGTNKSNKLVEEGNVAVEAANGLAKEGGAKYSDLFSEANIAGFPGNRDQLKTKAQEVAGLLDKSAAQFTLAGDKFDEASQQMANKTATEYWSLKVKVFRKMAESKLAFRDLVLLMTDETIEDSATLTKRGEVLLDRGVKLGEEAAAFTQQADKMEAEHKDVFNK